MIKRLLLVVFLILVIVCIVQFVKENILSKPQRIYSNIMAKYKHLNDLEVKDIVYSPNREIKLLISYMNILPIGEAKVNTKEISPSALKLLAEAKTSGVLGVFYKAEANLTSLIDKDKFYPEKYTENLYYEEEERTKEIVFDQKKHIAIREDNKYKIPPMTFCPLSALYYLQSQNLDVGSIHQIKLVSKEEIYVLEAKVLEEKDDIIRLEGQVRREDLSSTHGAEFEFWISNKLRIPLLFKLRTQAGIIIARAI